METKQLEGIVAQIADMESRFRKHAQEFSELREQYIALKKKVDSMEDGSTRMHSENSSRLDVIQGFIAKAEPFIPFLTEIMGERRDRIVVKAWFNKWFSSGKRIAAGIAVILGAIGMFAGAVGWLLGHLK